MIEYSEKVKDRVKNPRNYGTIKDADGVGEIGDPECGDYMKVYLKVENNSVKDIRYQILGCPAAIACASAMTEIVMGKQLEEALVITDEDIVDYIDGLPEFKVHCSALGASGFRVAVMDYYTRTGKL